MGIAGQGDIRLTLAECRDRGVEIVCFPETYLPGLRGADRDLPPVDQPAMEKALEQVAGACGENKVAAVLGMEWKTESGLENRAFVIDRNGKILGYQTKNQITPGGESEHYVPDGKRQMFEVEGVRFWNFRLPRRLAVPGDRSLGRCARRADRLSAAGDRL